MKNIWVFGASRSIGREMTERLLARGDKVTTFSRSRIGIAHENWTSERVDFGDLILTRKAIAAHMLDPPDAAVFCQRFRVDPEIADLGLLPHSNFVEVAPPLEVAQAFTKAKNTKPLSLVLLSSVAGTMVHRGDSLAYHLAKTDTLALTRWLSAQWPNVTANCVVPGRFRKYPRASYTPAEQDEFAALERMSPSGYMPTTPDICAVLEFFIDVDVRTVRGQTLTVGGGISLMAQDSVMREMMA